MLMSDKTILIAGAGPGLGRRMAILAAGEGARQIHVSEGEGAAGVVMQEVLEQGGEAIGIVADISRDVECDKVAEAAVQTFGGIDCLINSAFSTAGAGWSESGSLYAWVNNMNVACFGALCRARALLPAMQSRGGGSTVNISSQASVNHVPGQSAYAVAKAALKGLTRQLAVELGKLIIRVNCARPGWTWGPATQRFLSTKADSVSCSIDELLEPVRARMPLGRSSTDEECARAVLFLASDYSCVITGVTLEVNGGERMSPWRGALPSKCPVKN